MLLFGQNLGVNSDVYSFWHSSQAADPRLNISAYSSSEADKYLESGRLSNDPKNRAQKYTSFVNVWAADVPAVLLYSPYYLYGQSTTVSGITDDEIATPADRFYNIQNWSVRTTEILKKNAPK